MPQIFHPDDQKLRKRQVSPKHNKREEQIAQVVKYPRRDHMRERLAARLHLPNQGSAGVLNGIAGSARGEKTRLRDWSIGSVRLPAGPIAALGLSGPGGRGPAGLLGSDVLSRFGKVAVDYEHSRLILDPRLRR